MGLQKNLKLCKGMRSEITVNIDVEDELSNWASGVLIWVTFSNNNSGFDIILIKFVDENIGWNCRNFYNSKINTAWTPILKVKKASMVGWCKSLHVTREQFPIRAAAASTCRRCQWNTMDLSCCWFQWTMFYTLSSCVS